jgi:hypothetical protein
VWANLFRGLKFRSSKVQRFNGSKVQWFKGSKFKIAAAFLKLERP